jgi:hypothetical protein
MNEESDNFTSIALGRLLNTADTEIIDVISDVSEESDDSVNEFNSDTLLKLKSIANFLTIG